MHGTATGTRLRLPDRLAYTVLRVAVAGTLACSTSDHSPKPADASADVQYDDSCPPSQQFQCLPAAPDASCPQYVCNPVYCDISMGCETPI